MSEIERKKWEIVRQNSYWISDRITSPPLSIQMEVCGIQVQFHIHGKHASEIKTFLSEYFFHFPIQSNQQGKSIQIDLNVQEGALSQGSHPFWNEVNGEFRRENALAGEQFVIHRDFIARISSDGLKASVTIPKPDHFTTDGIDNVLTLLISKQLPQHHALALHASTVSRGGFAYIFFGASGAGKSTLAQHCYLVDGLKVLSGDQIYLKILDQHLYAYPCATTIPEFPRHHSGWYPHPLPVAALTHLIQSPQHGLKIHSPFQQLPLFLRETIYQPSFDDADCLLNLATSMISMKNIGLCELSYPLGISFWNYFDLLLKLDSVKSEREKK